LSARRYSPLLVLLGLQRLLELLYSQRNERQLARRDPNAPLARPGDFKLITAANVALFTLPALERRLRRRPPPLMLSALGWAATLSAIGLRLSVVATLRQQWNVRAIVPNDLQVIDRGPYRFIKHPNYLALGLEFLGVPLIGGAYISAVTLGALNAVLLSRRIRDEEALLMAIPQYRAKMGSKPRFFPRLVSAP
jgi:methyltransferase